MKIVHKHLVDSIKSSPSIAEISEKLFQLGHEHEIENGIFDMEFTPNRGDCLSVNGLLRDLKLFYDINLNHEVYENEMNTFDFKFVNNAKEKCPKISFLKIDIENELSPYKGVLKSYFNDLSLKKNNFFTDISNFISYETGQPTHCYDASKIDDLLSLENIECENEFETLLDKKIELKGRNLLFLKGNEIINLAGIIGGKSTSCSSNTRSVIIECAFFIPEEIIGKSVKYDIQSEAAHKFERGVDPDCHENILRRFIKIVEEHATIKNLQFFSQDSVIDNLVTIPFNLDLINKIIGIKISEKEFKNYLSKLGFLVKGNTIEVPSFRNDIKSINDIAEEIARAIGYDNIPVQEINIFKSAHKDIDENERLIKSLLIDNGFYEVINDPFEPKTINNSIKVDNPLDSNRQYLRTNLKGSLIKNLIYNERRQKESIKLFEVSDVYFSSNTSQKKKIIGIIASGRIGKNYIDFSNKINNDYLSSILSKFISKEHLKFESIARDSISSKSKNSIVYLELQPDMFHSDILDYHSLSRPPSSFIKYKKISEFPSSTRDLSFSITDYSKSNVLNKLIMEYKHELLKESYLFDYYLNEKTKVIKMAYRFVIQSGNKTITDMEVNEVMDDIIECTMNIKSVDIPGLKE